MDMVHSAVDAWQRERGMDHKSQAGTFGQRRHRRQGAMGLPAEKNQAHALALSMDMACGTEQYVWDAGSVIPKTCWRDTARATASIAPPRWPTSASADRLAPLTAPTAISTLSAPVMTTRLDLDALDSEALGAHRLQTPRRLPPRPLLRRRHTSELLKSGRPDLDAITSIEIDTYLEAITPEFRVNYEPQTLSARPASACLLPLPSS